MRLLILSVLALLVPGSSGCVTIPDIKACAVAGVIEAGADCSTTNTGLKSRLTAGELVEMLEPQPTRPDPNKPGKTLPARGGAVIIPADEYKRAKDAQETACRLLGGKCSFDGVPK